MSGGNQVVLSAPQVATQRIIAFFGEGSTGVLASLTDSLQGPSGSNTIPIAVPLGTWTYSVTSEWTVTASGGAPQSVNDSLVLNQLFTFKNVGGTITFLPSLVISPGGLYVAGALSLAGTVSPSVPGVTVTASVASNVATITYANASNFSSTTVAAVSLGISVSPP